jgi:glutamyl-tRNA synthetase
MDVRVRYAPSPTGLQHIGSVRTALFNYFYARSTGGKFLIRLEDTDRTRYADEYVQNLFDTLSWLGLEFDEGPGKGGDYGPYVQSERFELYKKYAMELIEKGEAYYCFCDSERLEALRKQQEADKSGSGYDRHCRALSPAEVKQKLDSGAPYVIRLKVPTEGVTRFHDHLLGDIEWKNADVSPDPVLLKSDGFPTYHLANVVDDHYMKITHVLRAQEWVSSTPLHVIMYQAFGWEHPEYCHLPMVMGQDGHKLSKRHGATAVNEFRANGYLPEALINYVGMLGASYEEGKEVFTKEEMCQLYKLEKLNKSPAIFDYKKLEWFNGQHIRLKSLDELYSLLLPYAVAQGLFGAEGKDPDDSQAKRFKEAIPLIRERISFLKDAPAQLGYLFSEVSVQDPADLIPKKQDSAATLKLMEVDLELLPYLCNHSEEESEAYVKAEAERRGLKMGDICMPLRVAVSGARVSPPLMGSLRILGEAASTERLKKAIEILKQSGL